MFQKMGSKSLSINIISVYDPYYFIALHFYKKVIQYFECHKTGLKAYENLAALFTLKLYLLLQCLCKDMKLGDTKIVAEITV